jgi:hypothetical protein
MASPVDYNGWKLHLFIICIRTMTPKDKAEKIFQSMFWQMYKIAYNNHEVEKKQAAKLCAIILVDEVIAERGRIGGYDIEEANEEGLVATNREQFWLDVKEQILKL